MRQHRGFIVCLFAGIVAAVAIGGCHDDVTTGPEVTSVQLAKPGSQDPEVTGTDPTGAPQDITLDVEVSGSGFDDGSTVELTLSGVPTEKVLTNSTRYRNSRTLIANITIAADAQVDFYDVEVTTSSRKKGIGTEMFEVLEKGRPTALVDLLEPGPEDPQDLADKYNLRSTEQAMWGDTQGKGQGWAYNLDLDPFPLTLAFSAEDRDPATWQYITDPDKKAECEEVSRRLNFLQQQGQLVGLFEFLVDVGSNYTSATVWFDVVVGDFKYNIRSWACTESCSHPTLTILESIQDGRKVTTFTVTGDGITVKKKPADWPPGKGEADPQSCGEAILDYVLTVTE